MNRITRDIGYMPVEFLGGRGVWTRELTAFCFQWIRLVGVTRRGILEADELKPS